MGSNRREDFEWEMPSDSDVLFDENTITEEEKEELGAPAPPDKKPCPKCGKELTWLADGSRPRAHKCVDEQAKVWVLTADRSKAYTALSDTFGEKVLQGDPSVAGCYMLGAAAAEDKAELDILLQKHGFEEEEITAILAATFTAPKPQGVTADLVIAKFIESRDEIAAMKKQFEESVAAIKELQDKRAKWLMTQLETIGGESLKTKVGTAFIDYKESATVADRAEFFKWVGEDFEERNQFLNSAVNKTAVKQRLEDGEVAPPGTNFVRIKDIKVRRA